MSKALEALENIKREAGTPYFSTLYDIDDWRKDFKMVEKELKALEIIWNKWVDLYALFIADDLEDYNIKHTIELTQEEFDLLKGC